MRCYWGAPDSALRAKLEKEQEDRDELRILADTLGTAARVTYFPVEEKWMGFDEYHSGITKFFNTEYGAIQATMKALTFKGELV